MATSDKREMVNADRRDEALRKLDQSLKKAQRRERLAPLGVAIATLATLALLLGGIGFLATRSSSDQEDSAQSAASSSSETPSAAALPAGPKQPYPASVQCDYSSSGDAAKPVSAPDGANVTTSGTTKVTIKTSQGDIPVEVNAGQSPCTANSFLHLVKEKFFDDTVCHRHVKSEGLGILQCGDPTGSGSGGPGYKFKDEFPTNGVDPQEAQQPAKYPRGTLAMANAGPDTNGSQFFLVHTDSTLPPKYNIFGTISPEGLETLQKISDAAPEGDAKPAQEVRITSAAVDS